MRSEKIRKILSETSDETKESVREYANKKVMEGNEVEKAAEVIHIGSVIAELQTFYTTKSPLKGAGYPVRLIKAYAQQQSEKVAAELTRTSKELDAMTTKYNELSKKYADLHKFAYGIASLKPLTEIKKS